MYFLLYFIVFRLICVSKLLQIAIMKSVAATIIGLALAASSAFAGDQYYSEKNPIYSDAPMEYGCACYNEGWDWSAFVAGVFPDGGGQGEIGGGLSLAYFFGKNFGLELSYAVFDTEPAEHHYSTLDMIYRFPFANCWSPYIRAGGGVYANGETEGMVRGGAGIEYKNENWNCTSIYLDGTHNWINGVENDTIARLGLKFRF